MTERLNISSRFDEFEIDLNEVKGDLPEGKLRLIELSLIEQKNLSTNIHSSLVGSEDNSKLEHQSKANEAENLRILSLISSSSILISIPQLP